MIATTLTVFAAIAILGLQVADSAITTRPSNTAVLSGNNATLHCTSSINSGALFWTIIPAATAEVIVRNCVVESAYVTQYSVNNTATGQCDLIILTARSNAAKIYACQEGVDPSYVYLTVLESIPTCGTIATNPIPENSVASSSCNVSYTSPLDGPTANMTWSAGCTVQPATNTSTFYSSTATVIAQRPTLQSCTCTTRFNAPPTKPNLATNAPSYSYSWSSASDIPVSYCPTVQLSPTTYFGFQNKTMLTCSAVAYPNVSMPDYNWTLITGSGVASGLTFNVTSVGNYYIRCTATNYLLGNMSQPCSDTATATGTTVASYCPTNVTIRETLTVNTFLCSADASPPVSVYQWTYDDNVNISNDQTFTVPSGVNYTITCTVTNFLYNNTNDPCIGNVSRSGESESRIQCVGCCQSCCPPCPTIVGCVAGGAVLIAGIVSVVYFFHPKCPGYKKNKLLNNRG